nr:uncharacterized protein LOC129521592 [Nyctereutes procyonoides]
MRLLRACSQEWEASLALVGADRSGEELGGRSVHTTLDTEVQADSPGAPLWRQEATQMNLTPVTSLPCQGVRLLLAELNRVKTPCFKRLLKPGGGPSRRGARGRGRSRGGPLAAQEISSLSEYALHMTRLRARLFSEIARPTDSKSMKVVKLFSEQPLAKRKETYDWYPNHNTYFALMGTLRFLGLYRDEHQDFKDEQLRLKKLRGKGKPRKGEGKRATKKK